MSLQGCGETVSLWNKIYVGFKNAQLLSVNNLYQTINETRMIFSRSSCCCSVLCSNKGRLSEIKIPILFTSIETLI